MRSISIIETLLLHPKIDVNRTTNKGSALHVAVQTEELRYVKKILQTGIDIEILDKQKRTAFEIAKNSEIIKYLKEKPTKKFEMIPYITRGKVLKLSSFYRHKDRLLLLNPFTNEFFLFKEKEVE